jgi:hypothetical protein
MDFRAWFEINYDAAAYEESLCEVCGLPYDDDLYMVNDKVWRKSGIKDMAHIECLEKKLGRRLNYGDFTQYNNTPVNDHNDKVQERMNEIPANWGTAIGGVETRWDI